MVAQYVVLDVLSDFYAPIQLIAPVNLPTTDAEYKALPKKEFFHLTKDQSLRIVPLNLGFSRLILLTDASLSDA